MDKLVGLGILTDRIGSFVGPHISAVTGRHPANGYEYSIGTSTFIEHRQRRFIVTAAHVAAKVVDGFELGVFGGQGESPGRLREDWWMSETDAVRKHKPWDEDIAILDVTDLLEVAKKPLPTSYFASDLTLCEQQAIFLYGLAANPIQPEDGRRVELLQRQDVDAMELHVGPLSSLSTYLPNQTGLRTYEFTIHFSASDNRDTGGRKLEFVLDAHGFSGSMLWRVKGSSVSPLSVSVNDLEVIGLVTKWIESESVIVVTEIGEVRKNLDACVDAYETKEKVPSEKTTD